LPDTGRRLLDVNREQYETPPGLLFVYLLDVGKLPTASASPACPEADEDRFAGMVRQ
jgi:hypothetical protein